MKTLLGVSIGVAVLIALNELQYIGRTSLAIVLLAISGILVVYGLAFMEAGGRD